MKTIAGVIILLVMTAYIAPPSSAAGEAYQAITGPCDLQFPRDHGPHPDARTEWWYYTGNLKGEDGRSFGFQLTFFRSRTAPPGIRKTWPSHPSEWRSEQIYLAHAALSDVSRKRFLHSGRMAREALGMAGTRRETASTEVFVNGWSTRISSDTHWLSASTGSFRLDLALKPLKPSVLHGLSGYSLKGSTPERASCYYSFTRLDTSGTIVLEGKEIPVHGTAWMDHEFSSSPLEPDLAGWDWFSMQLTDGTELMVYLMRKKDGSYGPASSGTFVEPFGGVVHLSRDEIAVEVLDRWSSPRSGARYPSSWRLRVPSLELDLTIAPKLADQELETSETTGITYWEGSVAIAGKGRRGIPLEGEGYVELTGYAKSLGGEL